MTQIDPQKLPAHVAIIMDGNGRWAKKRRMNRIKGHQKGTDSVRAVVRASREIGIKWLTLYAFSEENWKRPRSEVSALMKLLKQFLQSELAELQKTGIRLQTIGRTDKLPEDVRQVLLDTIKKTAENQDMILTLALSYGGRQEIMDAIQKIVGRLQAQTIRADDINEDFFAGFLYTAGMPDPDLLIRTSGEYRISNFMLWQIAYSEIFITSTLWPDFSKEEYLQAIGEFQQRERRFGGAVD
jgi:undecaprenyl diphosphate synthase